MATTIGDFKEMELTELCSLYVTIHTSFSNRLQEHDIPTLNLMRAIIIWKITGQAYKDYCKIVEELGEGYYESVNSVAVSKMEAQRVFRHKEKYGITDEVSERDYNKEIVDELKTVEFLEAQDTEEESKQYIEADIVAEREEYLNKKMDNRSITHEERMELQQIRLLK